MRSKIALATCSQFPSLSEDDRLLRAKLIRAGYDVEAPVWSDHSVEWEDFDAVILRSVWDYHKRLGEFESWLEDLENESARVFNPPAVLKWNINKRYLLELETKGCPIVPTQILASGGRISIENILDSNGWTEAVVKPLVSASAMRTVRVSRSNANELKSDIDSWIDEHDLMIQPFVADIESTGEYSLLYFGSMYGHTVVKKPAPGDFRVQQEYGGLTELIDPPPEIKRLGDDLNHWLFEKFNTPLLYARFDIVTIENRPAIGEVELVEPYLFFGYSPASLDLMTVALGKFLGR